MYYKKNEEEQDSMLPTFIDMNGLENNNGSFNEIFLKALVAGKVREAESISDFRRLFDNSEEELRSTLFSREAYLKVDRIIVVASSNADVPLPKELFSCVKKVSQQENIIPVFAVLTKNDQVSSSDIVNERKKELTQHLGITGDNTQLITNYCPDIDEEMRYHDTTFPYIDVPILKILIQVVRTQIRVKNNEGTLYSMVINRLQKTTHVLGHGIDNFQMQDVLCKCVQIIFMGILIYWMSSGNISADTLNIACSDYEYYSNKFSFTIEKLENICERKIELTTFPLYIIFFFLFFVFAIVPFIGRIIFRE